MKNTLSVVLFGAALLVSGCSTLHKSDSAAIQGTWKGQEPARQTQSACSLTASGNTFEFQRADSDEWYKGTFILRENTNPKQFVGTITACPAPQYNGTTFLGIYLLQDGTLTLTANEPGNLQSPAGFDAQGARKFLFNRH